MMGSGSTTAADPLSGMIALLGDPKAAAAELERLRKAKEDLAETEARAVRDSEANAARARELTAEATALDSRERSIVTKEKVLAKRAGEIEACKQDLVDSIAQHNKSVSLWNEKVSADKNGIKADQSDLRKQRNDIAKELQAAGDRKAEAEALIAKATEINEAAEALKAEYEAKLAQLAAIVKG